MTAQKSMDYNVAIHLDPGLGRCLTSSWSFSNLVE